MAWGTCSLATVVKRVVVSSEALKRAGLRSTKASAMLAGREVPDRHERSSAVQRFIDQQAADSRRETETASEIGLEDGGVG